MTKVRWTKCERENTFEFIFTPVYWGEKIYSNLFSLPFIGGGGGGGGGIYLNLFSLPFVADRKKYLNLFSLPFVGERKYI